MRHATFFFLEVATWIMTEALTSEIKNGCHALHVAFFFFSVINKILRMF